MFSVFSFFFEVRNLSQGKFFFFGFVQINLGKKRNYTSLKNEIINTLLIYRKEGVGCMIARECKQYLYSFCCLVHMSDSVRRSAVSKKGRSNALVCSFDFVSLW